MLVIGLEQPHQPDFVAGVELTDAECQSLVLSGVTERLLAAGADRQILAARNIETAVNMGVESVRLARPIARPLVETMTNVLLDKNESAVHKNRVANVFNLAKGSDELLDRYVHTFVTPSMQGVKKAQAIARGLERIMRRPDLIARP